jgi:Spy/CpxP family protein refolding chaperone
VGVKKRTGFRGTANASQTAPSISTQKKPKQKPWQKQCSLTRQQWKQGETLEEAQQKAKCEPEQAKLDEEK